MPTTILKGMAYVPKLGLAASVATKIETELMYETMNEEVFAGYGETDTYYIVPKFWYLKKVHRSTGFDLVSEEPEGPYKPWKFNGKLRPHQANPSGPHVATPDLLKELKKNRGVYAEAPCGSGKTVSGLWVAGALGGRTGVITPSESVFKQWVEQAHFFYPNIKVARWGGGKKERDGDLTVMMLQTLFQQDEMLDFDLLLADEAHLLSAPSFQRALWNLNFKYSIALTATGDRHDGLGPVFRRALSYRKVTLDTDQEPVEVHMHPYEHDQEMVDYYTSRSTFQLDLKLAEDTGRNAFLVKIISSLIKKRRRVLILGKYKDHLRTLAQAVYDNTQSKCAMFMGKPTKAEAERVREYMKDPACTVFATHGKGGVGLDVKHFDTLVHALPVSDPRQYTGRIQRALAGKATPVVIDPVDNIPQLIHRANKRIMKGYLTIERATVFNHVRWLRPKISHPRLIRKLL